MARSWRFICIVLALSFVFGACGSMDLKVPESNKIVDNIPDNSVPDVFSMTSLKMGEHPELNFGLSVHDNEKAIRDFVITRDGTLLILELNGKVFEYSNKGFLLETYDFGFLDKGLTSYRMAYSPDKYFYFLDGHNCQIVRAKGKEITGVLPLTEKAMVTEPGLIQRFASPSRDRLIVSALSPGDLAYYTYEWDVSGDEVVCLSDPKPGQTIDGIYAFKSELIINANGGLTDGVIVTIFQEDQIETQFEIHTSLNVIYGFNIFGRTETGGYLARISEFLKDGNTTQETFVELDQTGKIQGAYQGDLKTTDIIRSFEGISYLLRFEEKESLSPLYLSISD